MNMKNCTTIMDMFFALDKGERVPLELTIHFLLCGKCRRQIKALKKAEKAVSRPLDIQIPVTDSSIEAIMLQIDPQYKTPKNPIGIFGWIIAGVAMIAFMLSFRLSPHVNSRIQVMFYVIFAVVVTAYCAFFVGTNMDYFVKLLETKKA